MLWCFYFSFYAIISIFRLIITIKQVFLGPLEKKGILSKQEVSDLFANLELLLNVNQEMLNNFCGSSTKDSANLEEIDIQNVMIGEAFLSVVCLSLSLSLTRSISLTNFLLKDAIL